MTDFDPFERRFADALRSDADVSVGPFDPASIARGAMQIGHTRPGRAERVARRIAVANMRTRFAAAAVIAALVVGGALSMTRQNQPAVGGPSPTPGASVSPSEQASPSAVASPTAVPAAVPSWTATGRMARPRSGGLAVQLLDGTVLVVGGNSNVADPAAELYDPRTGGWTATGPMVTPRMQFTATRLRDGRVLVATGAADSGVLAAAELYDPDTREWTATGPMQTARYDATASLLPDGRVLVAGGTIVSHYFNPSVSSAELYDPATGSWMRTGSMQIARSGHTAILLPSGNVIVLGGWNLNDTLSYPLSSAEVYDSATGTWVAAHDMTQSTIVQTATLLEDGRILVAGGTYKAPTPQFVTPNGGIASTAELYDPTTDSWTATGSPSTSLVGPTATLLLDGTVLAAGGLDRREGLAGPAAELYDPTTGAWTATSPMIQGRSGHTATLLRDGRVLVAAGISELASNPGDVPAHDTGWLASAELYDPGTRR